MLVGFENCISFIDCLITRFILVQTNNFLSQVAANYVALVSNGEIFDSSLEKGVPYLFRVGSGQLYEGLRTLHHKGGGRLFSRRHRGVIEVMRISRRLGTSSNRKLGGMCCLGFTLACLLLYFTHFLFLPMF